MLGKIHLEVSINRLSIYDLEYTRQDRVEIKFEAIERN